MKAADAVSLTSCDSSDSIQSSTMPTPTPVPMSSSSSTVSEDCSSESGHCKSPPLVVSIDLELLRREDLILEPVSLSVEHSPPKLLADSDADSTADVANGLVDNTDDGTEECSSAHIEDKTPETGEDRMPEISDRTPAVSDDDFDSIYSRNLVNPADQATVGMSVDDAILNSLMTSNPDDFSDIIRPFSESGSENHVNIESDFALLSVLGKNTLLQSTQKPDNHVNGPRQSMVVNNWIQLPAPENIQSLSMSSRHVWCIGLSGKLMYSQLRGPGLRWFIVTTATAQQISVSPSGSLVWRLDSSSAYAACNISGRQPWGNKWTEVARGATWISVDDHIAW